VGVYVLCPTIVIIFLIHISIYIYMYSYIRILAAALFGTDKNDKILPALSFGKAFNGQGKSLFVCICSNNKG